MYTIFSSLYSFRYTVFVLISVAITAGCKKESKPQVSDKDQNYFVVTDNPNDAIDHAIFKFYEATGIASFYTDTIHKRRINQDEGIVDKYAYVKLAFTYTIQGGGIAAGFNYLSSKDNIPAVLELIEDDVLPKLPTNIKIPSLFLIDSFWVNTQIRLVQIDHGFTSIYGLNTLGIQIKDINAMSVNQRTMYSASVLAGVAEKTLNQKFRAQLQSDFYSVSTELAKGIFSGGLYTGIPYTYLVSADKVPTPENIGLLYHPIHYFLNANSIVTPLEQYDLRAFLTAAFRYTDDEFKAMYTGKAGVLKKFQVIRNLLDELGFKIPK